ncbi:outer membrane usher protein [Buttiauxella sp. B2]|uniref:outer membrane usher protein n=1 Tax=Buttiauxella sp. B2 TaxID=2587812 RepID=UPI00111FCE3F|nr:outer membrane usher protein [Buttiauxella sp. B2]TNV10775.1 outer membrane usher protein [Buttiauxella sp. B2]
MNLINKTRLYPKPSILSVLIFAMLSVSYTVRADDIQFNTDVLDVDDRNNISLTQFSHAGYLMPGEYTFAVRVNNQSLSGDYAIIYYQDENDKNNSLVCVPKDVTQKLGLKEKYFKQLTWWHNDECLDLKSLDGLTAEGNLSTTSLDISIPQAYMEYTSENWDPPSRWDTGVAGIILDYNVNAIAGHNRGGYSDGRYYNVSGNGTAGLNLGPWRLRADWQGSLNHETGKDKGTDTVLDVTQVYAYRPIPSIKSKLTVGESYYNSDVFDSFRFVGAGLESDDNMLPPNLRGYAPEVTGVAKTNAKVTISQKGRVLYQTQVAPGPFRIQNLNDSVTGQLDVKVEEQGGEVKSYSINTSDIPYLTRPGTLRYKTAVGQPEGYVYKRDEGETYGDYANNTYTDMHHTYGAPIFGAGEFSWGINSGWSLYGGVIGSEDYSALSLGIGRDLLQYGALAFDTSVSRADVPNEPDTKKGTSSRLSYSKDFDAYDSQVTFAGYRFSTRDFMTMDEYLDSRVDENTTDNDKQMYTITFNKQFREKGLSVYLNYSHETYWDSPKKNNFSLSASQTFDAFNLRNLSVSLTLYKNQYDQTDDYGGYLSLSVPVGDNSTISFNSTVSNSTTSSEVSYFKTLDANNSYQLATGGADGDATARAYYNHLGDRAEIDVNTNYQAGTSSSVGLTLRGGLTATREGAALHRVNDMGGTRMLVDTSGVTDVPVEGFGGISYSNMFGKAVIADVNSYYRSSARIDLDKLDDNADVSNSVVEGSLTEGAIGYRKFAVISGEKAMATLRLEDGSSPPFGATVFNTDGLQTGIVNDDGSAYLSGINSAGKMVVKWDGKVCDIALPTTLPAAPAVLLLPCQELRDDKAAEQQTATDKATSE